MDGFVWIAALFSDEAVERRQQGNSGAYGKEHQGGEDRENDQGVRLTQLITLPPGYAERHHVEQGKALFAKAKGLLFFREEILNVALLYRLVRLGFGGASWHGSGALGNNHCLRGYVLPPFSGFPFLEKLGRFPFRHIAKCLADFENVVVDRIRRDAQNAPDLF